LDQLRSVLDKVVGLLSEFKKSRYTGKVTLTFNFSQGGIGAVELTRKEQL